MASITLKINNKDYHVDIDPKMPLLWAIRDVIGLTGTKYGCGIAQCGACTIHLDGNPMQTLGEVALKDRVRISVRDPLSSREPGDVLLAQREIDCHQLIEGGKLAHVGFDQANRGHCASDCLLRLLLALLFVLLRSFFWLPAHGEAHSAAKQLALVAFCLWPAGGRRAGRQTR